MLLSIPLSSVQAAGIEVKASSESSRTPALFGYNVTTISPNSLAWLVYADGNSARIRSYPHCFDDYLGSEESISRWTFVDRRRHQIVDDLRDYPEDFDDGNAQRHVDWGEVHANFEACKLDLLGEKLADAGQNPLILIPSKTGDINTTLSKWSPPLDPDQPNSPYWGERWAVWRSYFIQAYYWGRKYEATNFEFVNEPLVEFPLTLEETVERMTLAGDAIQRAFDTLNRWRATVSKPALQPTIMAAAFADGRPTDFREDVVNHRELEDFYSYSLRTAWAFPTAFNAYSYHYYVNNSPRARLSQYFHWNREDLDSLTSPDVLPMFITETNLVNGKQCRGLGWDRMTLDDPEIAVNMADLVHELNTAGDPRVNTLDPSGPPIWPNIDGFDGAYIFKFSSNDYSLFWYDGSQIGGAKRSAEVVKLYAEGFAGARERKQFIGTSDWLDPLDPNSNGKFTFDAAYDSNTDRYTIMSINHYSGTSSVTLTIDLDDWNIPTGTPVLVKEVSSGRRAEVRRFYTVNSSHRVVFPQPAQSVELITIPTNVSSGVETVVATEDAYVRAGSNRGTNFGTHTLYVYANKNDANNRRVAYIKIELPDDVDADEIEMAVLKVTARSGKTKNSGSGTAVAHVYGIDDDSWKEGEIRWNRAPNLGRSTATLGTIDEIGDNFLKDVGISAHPLGAITGNSNSISDERVDVTNYIRSQTDGVATFMIIREIRYPGDTDPEDECLWIASTEDSDESRHPVLEFVRR